MPNCNKYKHYSAVIPQKTPAHRLADRSIERYINCPIEDTIDYFTTNFLPCLI